MGLVKRARKLELLESGWHDGSGEAFDKEGASWATDLLLKISGNTEKPRLYPCTDGSWQAEWSNEEVDITVELCLKNKTYVTIITYYDSPEKDVEFRNTTCEVIEELLIDNGFAK